MGKITKTMQQKHRDTLSPWLEQWVRDAAAVPLPRLPQYLSQFPKPWELPRDDLYHWIPLLNRFDTILESFCLLYKLNVGPQTRDFGCDVLSQSEPVDGRLWDQSMLTELGYSEEGDKQLLICVLNFSKMLLENCGNRSIYSSSIHLSSLLHTTDLEVLAAILEVSLELAKRYQASLRRINMPSRPPTSLLNSHYNIELERIQTLAAPFVKTPAHHSDDHSFSATTTPASKGKEKTTGISSIRQATPTYLYDIASIFQGDSNENSAKWNGWGDIRVTYTPQEAEEITSTASKISAEVQTAVPNTMTNSPSTPTPLRRSSTTGSSSRVGRSSGSGEATSPSSPTLFRTSRLDQEASSSSKRFDISQSVVLSKSSHELLDQIPQDMPKSSRYEYLNRLRIAKALLGNSRSREQALAVRLLAITNLAYIYPESMFGEKVLRSDHQQPRQMQLIFQLVEVVHPSTTGASATPLWLQTIALLLLEAISSFHTKYLDVSTALNAYATHGVLLYLLRKAVAQMKEESHDENSEKESWRKALFSLTQSITMNRGSPEAVTAGLLELLVDILKMRSDLAERTFQSILHFIDNVLSSYQGAFQYFCNVNGLDALTDLFVHEVEYSAKLSKSGQGTKPNMRSSVMDYEIPYHQQHNLKWLLKFIHHALANQYMFGGNNTERLLRNLADNTALLKSIREIMENMSRFGSIVWTASITILSDFLNNDPSSANAILESGLIKTYLMSITGDFTGDWSSAVASRARHHEERSRETGDGDDGSNRDSPAASTDDGSNSGPWPGLDMKQAPLKGLRQLVPHESPANSIHPTAETITTIPTVLNSICLSRTGEKLVVESKALEHYFEIFESPRHIHLLMAETADCAQIVGSSIDELARHHPSLISVIGDAVIQTLARVVNLGISKSESVGWGTKLVLPNLSGKIVPADERRLWENDIEAPQRQEGIEHEANDMDVEMIDIGCASENGPAVAGVAQNENSSSPSAKKDADFLPYVYSISSFLSNYVNNNRLREQFADQGGIELLLDLAESPALPPQYFDSTAAVRLHNVFQQLMEVHAIRGMPSLLQRTLKAVGSLAPLVDNQKGEPFVAPFVEVLDRKNPSSLLSSGTKVAHGLLRVQSFVKIICQCLPYSSRHGTHQLPTVNVYDYLVKLVQGLGPLLRVVLADEMNLTAIVPAHWQHTKVSDRFSDAGEKLLEEILLGTRSLEDKNKTKDEEEDKQQKLTDSEKMSHRFQNFQTLHLLLHGLMPTAIPFFQCLGKALFPKRPNNNDPWYYKEKQWEVADSLASAVLDPLAKLPDGEPNRKDFHYWIIMLHTVCEMIADTSRAAERMDRVMVIVPVLLAFKERGGLNTLKVMLRIFIKELSRDSQENDEYRIMKKLAGMGIRRILDLCHLIVSGRYIVEALTSFNLVPVRQERSVRLEAVLPCQIVVETRMAFWPVLMELWQSPILLSSPIDILNKLIDILRAIASAEDELVSNRSAERASLTELLKRSPANFNWRQYDDRIQNLEREGYDVTLVREAIYRACGDVAKSGDYCKAHTREISGERNPIPDSDAYQPENTSAGSEPMAVDDGQEGDTPMSDNPARVTDTENEEGATEDQSQTSESASSSSAVSNQESVPPLVSVPAATSANSGIDQAASNSVPQPEIEEPPAAVVTKEQMDTKRADLRRDLIERCLEVLQAHPTSAYNIADLINAMIPKEFESEREDACDTLMNALLSFEAEDEEARKTNAQSIAAYAHLLALLLSNDIGSSHSFLSCSISSITENIGSLLDFVKLHPGANEELPPWLPYILLVFEIAIKEDMSPPKITWTPPENENDTVNEPVREVKPLMVNSEQCGALLEAVLELLPRIGRDETLSVAALRMLVILTRNRSMATTVGDKKNLQRLFVMAKQLCSMGSERLDNSRITANLAIILRQICEDEENIKQIMKAEIKGAFDAARSGRSSLELPIFVRNHYSSVLRDPELFVEVSSEMLVLDRFSPPGSSYHRAHTVSLKLPPTPPSEKLEKGDNDSSVSQQGGLADTAKKTTEDADKEMVDIPKPLVHGAKRPVLENPDGVIQFLLTELFNYREVDDKDTTPAGDSKETDESSTDENKDKKPSKPTFKTEEHPIFIYRCLLLNCLSELLKSYTRAKVEFINFKRNAPLLSNTPVKPRSNVLNYLINDLVCNFNANNNVETISTKKKLATGLRASQVLVSLVLKTKERPIERSQDKFEYDDDSDLFFVQKFVLDTVLKAYRDASLSNEAFEIRFGRMVNLAELMSKMMGVENETPIASRHGDPATMRTQSQVKRLMYEKGYLGALTTSIADIDLTLQGVKKNIKVILRVLHSLTDTGIQLSRSNIIPASPSEEDEIASASSLSDIEDVREETPDLYRNSALGMMEHPHDDDYSEDSQDEDEEMYDDDEYGDEMDYDEEDVSGDDEDNISDEDEALAEIEDMAAGEHAGVIEVMMGDEDEDEMDEDDEEHSDHDSEIEELDASHHHHNLQIVDENGNLIEDDGESGWESAMEDEEHEDEAEDGDEDEEIDYEAGAQGMAEHDHIERLLEMASDEFGAEGGGFNEAYLDEDEAEDDDDDDAEEMDEDDYVYEDDYHHEMPPPNIPASLGWDTLVVEHPTGNQLHTFGYARRHHLGRFIGNRFDVDRDTIRPGYPRSNPAAADEGVNPLLRRGSQQPTNSSLRPAPHMPSLRSMFPPTNFPIENPMEVLQGLLDSLPTDALRAPGLQLQISQGPRGEIRAFGGPHIRETRTETRRSEYQEPLHAVSFNSELTQPRWVESARLIFGGANSIYSSKADRVTQLILAILIPDAMARERKAKEEAERLRKLEEDRRKKREEEEKLERERKEAEEKAAKEKKEAEEREKTEREASEAAARATMEQHHIVGAEAQPMEGIESTERPQTESTESCQGAGDASTAEQPRVVTTIRGEEVDVTDLGIDAEYLEALPDEFREEVIAQAVTARRSEARENAQGSGDQQGEAFQEFLDALPHELREEILSQERNDQRRREASGQRNNANNPPAVQEMDPASILLTFSPELRQEALMAQGHELLDQLPPEMAAQVRAMTRSPGQQHNHRTPPAASSSRSRQTQAEETARTLQRKKVVQMLDPSGIATLLRLMFISQDSRIRSSLFDVFSNVCENHHNRLEVVRSVLQILQDGSVDMDAVERSFSHLSLRAKAPPKEKEPNTPSKETPGRTPQSIKRSFTTGHGHISAAQAFQHYGAEASPPLIVQQCLDLLATLCSKNQRIASIFLSEHDYSTGLKRTLSKKGKGKEPPKAHKFAINTLLALLERETVIESTVLMHLLAEILEKITSPIATRERRRLQAEETARKTAEDTELKKAEESKRDNQVSDEATAGPVIEEQGQKNDDDNQKEIISGSKEISSAREEIVKAKLPQLPVIPNHHLTLVCRVFVARECSSRTYQSTIATIKHLSFIPGAKAVIGEELIRQADTLSRSIVNDLEQLVPHIQKAQSGTEIQGIALAKFSPTSSDQNKLLRVLTALDHVFDPKQNLSSQFRSQQNANRNAVTEHQDLLGSLYRNSTFNVMWNKLSDCLRTMQQRESMANVATILLPLIESLMVVCKNVAVNDQDASKGEPILSEAVFASPPPESPISNFFFTFTEENKRILNDLVRSNPKLMSGTFSLLVKNSKVLDFDNKRNWFNRSIHQRNQPTRQSYPTLQLQVRRDHVFHDSFRSLYYKSGDEMKYGKLNIRFHGEEGVDAGGVTREWFQVLARQMFDPNYALFIPVSSDRTTFHPNKLSDVNQEHLMFFKFIGRVIGKALYENRLLDCHFSRAVYKRILGKHVSVKDMESFDPDYYKSLCWILENDITDILTETFTVDEDKFGVMTTWELKENGTNIPVTEANKQEYVRLVVEHKLLSSVKDQMQNFLQGFHDIIPADLIQIFNEQELELLISGLPDVDIDDWKANTEYHNYPPNAPQIQWFWRAVRSFDKEEKAKLLQFVTGTSKVPLNGFKDLEGMNGVSRFNIHRDFGAKDRLPSSHTCFNQLDLPEYESYDQLRSQLLKAITTGGEYFGFA